MAKSIKLDNELLLDSTSIAHNKKTLKQQFENNIYQLNEANVVSTIQSLNTMITPGVYNLTTGSTSIVGLPPSFSNAFTLIVSIDKAGNSACIRQELTREERSFVRYTSDSGATWSDWAIMATYKVGDIIMTSTNVGEAEMAARFGGTWSLVDKEFTPLGGNQENSSWFTVNTTNCSGFTGYWYRVGHTITFDFRFTNKVQLTDSTVEIGTVKKEVIGMEDNFYFTTHASGWTDGGQCHLMAQLDAGGTFKIVDITPDSYVATGSSNYVSLVIVAAGSRKLDSACNKFYWKRIS